MSRLKAPGRGQGFSAGLARIRRAILVTETLGDIRPCFQFQVDFGIRHFIICGAVADDARAYGNDPKAVALTLEGINGLHFAALEDPFQKTFFLPLGHSEDLRNQ